LTHGGGGGGGVRKTGSGVSLVSPEAGSVFMRGPGKTGAVDSRVISSFSRGGTGGRKPSSGLGSDLGRGDEAVFRWRLKVGARFYAFGGPHRIGRVWGKSF